MSNDNQQQNLNIVDLFLEASAKAPFKQAMRGLFVSLLKKTDPDLITNESFDEFIRVLQEHVDNREEEESEEEEEEPDWDWECCGNEELHPDENCPTCGKWCCNCEESHIKPAVGKKCRRCQKTNPSMGSESS